MGERQRILIIKRQRRLKKLEERGKLMEQQDCCKNCYFCRKIKPEDLNGECRFNPPVPFLIAMEGPLGQPQPGVISYWPPVGLDRWCGKHTLIIEGKVNYET